MRNSSLSMFGVLSVLSAGEVVAQPVATDFRTPVWPVDQSQGGYNNKANPFLALFHGKYHMGEDWNGNEGGSTDYGDPVYPIAIGKVVKAFDQKGSVGKVVVIKHLLPDGQTVYSLYAHLSQILVSLNQTVSPAKPLGKIGDANGYYAGAAHLHLELRRVNETMSPVYYQTLTTAIARKYFDPSLFIDDRATKVEVALPINSVVISDMDGIEISNYAPGSLAYVTCEGKTSSLAAALSAGWVGPLFIDGKVPDDIVFGPSIDFVLQSNRDCVLTIVIPGHHFQPSRARGDMIKAADRAGFTRVKLETLKDFGDDGTSAFDLRALCFDNGAKTAVACAIHATHHDNPLLRYIVWFDPVADVYLDDWTAIDPNDVD